MKLAQHLRGERGAEAVEWILVAALLTVVAHVVLGPNGVLRNGLDAGVGQIAARAARPSSPPLAEPPAPTPPPVASNPPGHGHPPHPTHPPHAPHPGHQPNGGHPDHPSHPEHPPHT